MVLYDVTPRKPFIITSLNDPRQKFLTFLFEICWRKKIKGDDEESEKMKRWPKN